MPLLKLYILTIDYNTSKWVIYYANKVGRNFMCTAPGVR